MDVQDTLLNGVLLLRPRVLEDKRGYFYEAYNSETFSNMGLPSIFKQDNQALSKKGTLRGLHYQLKFPQGKLVRVTSGTVFDVSVDIRKGSPTFGQHFGTILSDKNHLMIYIPEGFAHGYAVLSDAAIFQYKCTEFYHPEDEYGLRWNDPELAIDWRIQTPIISSKDKLLPLLKDINEKHFPAY